MIFITRGYTELAYDSAVVGAIKVHLKRFLQLFPCSLLIPSDSEAFSDVEVETVTYRNILQLFLKILSLGPRDYFACELTTVILLRLLSPFSGITFWVQGSLPDESFMRNRSMARYRALALLEWLAFAFSNKVVYVSESMREFYGKKYRVSKKKESAVIPCASRLPGFDKSAGKIKNSFVYLGGVSEWQCFDETVGLFRKIEQSRPDARLFVITKDTDEACAILASSNVNNFSIETISDGTELAQRLSQIEYGFLIRDSSNVNIVSSPIKLAEYLSCAVKPIVTGSIADAFEVLRRGNVAVCLEYNQMQKQINFALDGDVPDVYALLNAYRSIYSEDRIMNEMRTIWCVQ